MASWVARLALIFSAISLNLLRLPAIFLDLMALAFSWLLAAMALDFNSDFFISMAWI